jgi:hypothetical protein
VIVTLMVLGGAFIGAILWAAHMSRMDLDHTLAGPLLGIIAVAALFLAMIRPSTEQPYISAADRVMISAGLTAHKPTAITDCPPAPDLDGKAQVFTRSRADNKPSVAGCITISGGTQ